jgi:hypothetical protein
MEAPIAKMVVIIGLPENIRGRIQAKFKGSIEIRLVPYARDGGHRLDREPLAAKHLIESYADEAIGFEHVVLVVLPYHRKVELVEEVLSVLAELGSKVCRQPLTQPSWAKVPKEGMNNTFQQELLGQLCECIDHYFPEETGDEEIEEIKFEILRGLATHNKMGENNHSHEDDLWKARAQGMGPRGRERIIRDLMNLGILHRKKNSSAGGKGWVYWIDDVPKACQTYPDLNQYV